jgi:predicted O-methyltransferase YrrM
VDAQLALARELDAYRSELADVPRLPRPGRVEFAWENWSFDGADAIVYYGLVRSLKPSRVVEIGAGWSSLLLARALERNDTPCAVTLIEPGQQRVEPSALPSDWEVRESLLQHADPALFEQLGDGDVCFFDGSHCVHTGSDVNWFLFEVLPRLKPGVLIHIHDILFPDDYVDRWILEEGLSWNEQYAVQAFLMHNDAYDVLIANHLLFTERRAEIDALHGGDGGSLWLRKRGP